MLHSQTINIFNDLPNPHKFSLMIENLSRDSNMDYVDTILNYCEDNDMEYDTVAKLLNPTLKDKIKKEFVEKRNLLPKVAKLKKA